MFKRWSLMVLGFVVVLAGLWMLGVGRAVAADKPVITSKNDPTKPVPGGVRWFGNRHRACVDMTQKGGFDLCLLGDSITAMWPGNQFNKYFGKFKPANFGIGGDRCENVLWRMENGELKGTNPKLIVLLIGTNNQGMNTVEEVAIGVHAVVDSLREKCPKSKILVLGIFPSRGTPVERSNSINAITAKLDDGKMIKYQDVGSKFLDKEGKIMDGILADGVHLTPKGYDIWGEAVVPTITKMMETPAEPAKPEPTKPAKP